MKLLVAIILLCTSFMAWSDDASTAKEFLSAAMKQYDGGKGLSALVEEINKCQAGPCNYRKGAIYLFIHEYDKAKQESKNIAHGEKKALIGMNVYSMKDGKDKLFVQDFIKTSEAQASMSGSDIEKKYETENIGYVNYLWPNSDKGNAKEIKKTYIRRLDDNHFMACGFFKN